MSGKDEQKVIEESAAGEADGGEALYEEAPVAAPAAIVAIVETRTTELPDGTVAAADELTGGVPTLDIDLIKRVLETALLTSPEPLSLNEMKRMFPRGETNNELVRKLLDEIRVAWEGRGVELVNVASGWRFRSKPELQRYLDKLNPLKAPKYSRAVMETLAIIAYRQPVTRGDIEVIVA